MSMSPDREACLARNIVHNTYRAEHQGMRSSFLPVATNTPSLADIPKLSAHPKSQNASPLPRVIDIIDAGM